jgi:hypothetical protein
VQCRATGSAHDHPLETKIMLVHLRFMTTLPLRFLPPLHINSPPAPTRWACIRFLRFSISDFAPADGHLRCSRKGTSARPLSSSSYAVFNIVVWRIPGIKAVRARLLHRCYSFDSRIRDIPQARDCSEMFRFSGELLSCSKRWRQKSGNLRLRSFLFDTGKRAGRHASAICHNVRRYYLPSPIPPGW